MLIWRSLDPQTLGRLLEIAARAYRNGKSPEKGDPQYSVSTDPAVTGQCEAIPTDNATMKEAVGLSYHPLAMREVCPGWLRLVVTYQRG